MFYAAAAYLLLTLATACAVYASWRRRLHKSDVWGALLLGVVWFLVLPLMVSDRVRGMNRRPRSEAHARHLRKR